MITSDILQAFRDKVSREVDIESEGLERYVVYTPFRFDDGDHFVITLNRDEGQWLFTDEGHTLMHLSYQDIDLSKGQRAAFVEEMMKRHGIQNLSGELRLPVPDEAFGDALFSFVQGLSNISTVTEWTQERVRGTFWEDFQGLIEEIVPAEKRIFRYHNSDLDPQGNYPIDCYVQAPKRPCHIYAIGNDTNCREATISVMFYERERQVFDSVAIYEDLEKISGRALAQLTNVVGKQFASLGVRDRIEHHLKDEILQVA